MSRQELALIYDEDAYRAYVLDENGDPLDIKETHHVVDSLLNSMPHVDFSQVPDTSMVAAGDRGGFVYILHSNGAYKIGHAKIVDKRIEKISPALPYPVELEIAISTDDRYALEKELHERYKSKRLNGEWFALDHLDLFDLGVRK